MSPAGRYDSLGLLGRLLLPVNLDREFDSVVALACYFDESSKGRNYAVAGYLGTVDVWAHVFSPAWSRVIADAPHKISEFKQSDCRNKRNEFDDRYGWTDAKHIELTSRLVSVLIDSSNAIGFSMVVRFPGIVADGNTETQEQRNLVERVGYRMAVQTCLYDILKYHADFFKTPREYIRPIPDKKHGFHKIFADALESSSIWAEFGYKLKEPIPEDSKGSASNSGG
jgi:hypothetical protein